MVYHELMLASTRSSKLCNILGKTGLFVAFVYFQVTYKPWNICWSLKPQDSLVFLALVVWQVEDTTLILAEYEGWSFVLSSIGSLL